jgi:hypothetical protein
MGKKSRTKKQIQVEEPVTQEPEISTEIELLFKKILRGMSWTVGICFLIIITLPNFDFHFLDAIIKIVFYLGVLCLLFFILFEFFGESFKRLLSKKIS